MAELAGQLDVYHALGELPPIPDDWALVRVDRWLGSLSANTAKAYARDTDAWLGFLADLGVRLQDARPVDAETWVAEGAGLENPAASTLTRRLAACSSLYSHLGLPSPFARIERPTPEPSPTRVLTRDEVTLLTTTAREVCSLRDQVWIHLALLGVKRTQAVHLDAGDVTWERVGHHRVPPKVAAVVQAYLDGRTDGPLLANANGGRVDPSVLSRATVRAAELAGIRDPSTVTARCLQATAAT